MVRLPEVREHGQRYPGRQVRAARPHLVPRSVGERAGGPNSARRSPGDLRNGSGTGRPVAAGRVQPEVEQARRHDLVARRTYRPAVPVRRVPAQPSLYRAVIPAEPGQFMGSVRPGPSHRPAGTPRHQAPERPRAASAPIRAKQSELHPCLPSHADGASRSPHYRSHHQPGPLVGRRSPIRPGLVRGDQCRPD
jgi:hypothetical protein